MKITPIAQGTSAPGTVLGQNPETGSHDHVKKHVITMRTNHTPPSVNDLIQKEPIEAAQQTDPEKQTANVEPNEQRPEVTRPIGAQFANLAKQKRALQLKERELLEKEKTLTQQNQSPGLSLEQIKKNPLGVLKDAGVSYDDLTQAILGNPQSPELDDLKAEIKSLKDEMNKTLESRDLDAERSALRQIRRDVDFLVRSNDEFEAIRWAKAEPEVVELIHRTWLKTGEILDAEEAAKLVEAQVREEYVDPLTKLKTVQSKFAPKQEEVTQMRTLTSRDGASVPLTAKQRAMLAFEGKLNRG